MLRTNRSGRPASWRSPVRAARSAAAPRLEALEGRVLFAAVTFTIDPAASSLRLSGQVAGQLDLKEQNKGSLTAAYEGVILADADADSIEFLGGSNVAARSRGKFDPGNTPANYAGRGETGGFISVKVGDAAVRGFTLDLTSGVLALAGGAFAASGVTLSATAGQMDYDLRVGNDGTIDLANRSAADAATAAATLTGSGQNQTLTIPVDVSYSYSNAELRLRGTLVAKSGAGGGDTGDPNTAHLGDGAAKSVAFTDADGSTGVVALRGGTADVLFENATGQTNNRGVLVVAGSNVRLVSIAATGTTAASRLLIRGTGGADGAIDVPSVTADGALGALGGPGVNLTGTATAGGPVAKATVGRLVNATVSAPSVGVFKVFGDVSGSTVTLGAPFVAGTTSLGRFTALGTVTGSRVAAAGGIGAFRATSLVNSEVYAGVTGTDRFPSAAGALPTEAGIAKLTLGAMDNSVIAANNLGKLKLGVVDTDNGGVPFGVVGDAIAGLQAVNAAGQRLKLARLDDPAALPALLAAQTFTAGDFAVRLV